jgi:uncharacterized iron-regulated protein
MSFCFAHSKDSVQFRLQAWLPCLLVALLIVLASCATVRQSGWLSTLDVDHALVGKIWSGHDKRWISERELHAELMDKKFILLGETHDNPDHHRLQMAVLKALIDNGRSPAIAMEQFDIEHQPAIDAAMRQPNTNAEAVADAGKLNRKSWQWEQYRPIVELAITQKLPLRAANLSRADGRDVFSKGFNASPIKFDDALFANTWNGPRADALKRELVDGHCGQLPDAIAPGMANVQRVRDAIMAKTMLEYEHAVLIAGRGHVRRDRAVPLYLQSDRPTSAIAVLAFVEVEAGKSSPQDYIDVIFKEAEPFDYVWFTPRVARKDPCEGMSLEGLRATPQR